MPAQEIHRAITVATEEGQQKRAGCRAQNGDRRGARQRLGDAARTPCRAAAANGRLRAAEKN